ncbi:MAG TPA: hypothetical protein VMS76_19945 [Planctomycetota bacterium]|nr:hypothetical protein [Planctomycetota bacterium]
MAVATEASRTALGLGACGLGGAIAFLLGGRGGEESPPRPGPPEVWVSDRDGQALIGLDRHLLVAARVAVPWPTEVEPCDGGGVWAASAREGDPLGAYDLLRVSPDGRLAEPIEVGVVIDLAAIAGGDALVVERNEDGSTRVRRFAADGRASPVAELPDASCASGARDRVIVGTASGAVLAFGGGAPRHAQLGGSICDVAPGPSSREWWALDRGRAGASRLFLLDEELRTLWSLQCELEGGQLAPVPSQERVWLVDAARPFAFRFGPGGVPELACGPLPQVGLGRAAALDDGSLLVTSPGALLRLDARGRIAPGQGGFDFLTDVAR